MSYVKQFMALRCAGDVLDACGPFKNGEKEINESMAVLQRVRKIVLAEPMKYTLVDLCSGNALTPVLAVHYLPIVKAYAVDINPHERRWDKVRRFEYLQADITKPRFMGALLDDVIRSDNVILTAVHPCSLARKVAEIYQMHAQIRHAVILPCCSGELSSAPTVIREHGKYFHWCFNIWTWLDFVSRESDMYVDARCTGTPKNIVVWGSK